MKIFLEPYIKIPIQYKYYQEPERTCGCKIHYDESNYCSDCGKKIEYKQVEKVKKLSIEELISEVDIFQFVYDNEYMYLFSNYSYENGIGDEVDVMTTIDGEYITNQIQEFKDRFIIQIELLQIKTKLTIDVKFGYMKHYN